jgi:Right handed beta helix region
MRLDRRSSGPLVAAAAVLALLAWPAGAFAQATRTWISGVGDDANPCSRTAPCKTWAGAIAKTAAGGEIDALDPGGFGALTITKSITIDGGGFVASALVSGTNGFNVSAGANDRVILRNIQFQGLNGSGLNGIQINSAKSVDIENCDITGFGTNGILFDASAASTVTVDHSRVTENAGNGILNDSTNPDDWINVTNSTVSDNGGNGVQTGNGGSAVDLSNIINSDIMNNGTPIGAGVYSDGPSAVSIITHDEIVANDVGLETDPTNGGTILTFGNNDVFASNSADIAPGTNTSALTPDLRRATHKQLIEFARRQGRAWKKRHHRR